MFRRNTRFHKKCGSTHIIRYDILQQISKVTVLQQDDYNFLDHQVLGSVLSDQGFSLEPLPFPGVIYVTEHGDNLWASKSALLQMFGKTPKGFLTFYLRSFYKNLVAHKVSSTLREEYGLYDFK